MTGEVELPEVWRQLQDRGFHADLLDRADRFARLGERDGFREQAQEVLRITGEGFLKPFNSADFAPLADDPHYVLKTNVLAALQKLSYDFSNRVPSSVWNSLACLMTRENPTEEASILSQQDRLPIDWWYVDAVLHALGKPHALFLHVQSRIFQESGMFFDHNCDCEHSLQKPIEGGMLRYSLPKENIRKATAALLSHLLSESVLILVDKLPFAMGLSPETNEVMALEGA